MKPVPGVYQLVIRMRRPAVITVGALGRCRFPAGWYVYTGSARNGLEQRIRWHLRQEKRRHFETPKGQGKRSCITKASHRFLKATMSFSLSTLANVLYPVGSSLALARNSL